MNPKRKDIICNINKIKKQKDIFCSVKLTVNFKKTPEDLIEKTIAKHQQSTLFKKSP